MCYIKNSDHLKIQMKVVEPISRKINIQKCKRLIFQWHKINNKQVNNELK